MTADAGTDADDPPAPNRDGETVYAAMEEGLAVVEDAAGDPDVRFVPTENRPECLAVGTAADRAGDGVGDDGGSGDGDGAGAGAARGTGAAHELFLGTFGGGLHYSVDGGRSFAAVPALADESVLSATVGPDGTVWAGTEPSGVYRSPPPGADRTARGDGGAVDADRDPDGPAPPAFVERPGLTDLPSAGEWSFPPRPDTHHVRWIAVAPDDPGQLYVAVEAGALVRSPDGGETWRDRPAGARRDNHTLATHPAVPDRVYAAAGDGYAESDDRGETWTYPQSGLDHRYVWGLAVDPGDPDRVLVSAADGAYAAHRGPTADAHVYRRTGRADGGDAVGDGRDGDGGTAATDAGDGTAATDAGDGGGDGASGGTDAGDDTDTDADVWTRVEDPALPAGEGITRAVFATAGPGTVYAATDRGLARSTDFGAPGSWERVPVDGAWDRFAGTTCRGLAVVRA